MRILYIGREEKGAVIVNSSTNLFDYSVDYTGFIGSPKKILDTILSNKTTYDTMIVDIEKLPLTETLISVFSKAINSGYKGKLIIKAPGYTPESSVVTACTNVGISYWIFSENISEAQEELQKALKGVPSLQNLSEVPEKTSAEQEKNSSSDSSIFNNNNKPVLPQNKPCKMIGIAGTGNRIGTTTQAILLTKVLVTSGEKACYIQANKSRFVESLANVYDNVVFDKSLEKFSYDKVDMFCNCERIEEILKLDYDYYIFDYGNIIEDGFDLQSYESNNLKILVSGVKPNEILLLDNALDKLNLKNLNYIFSFTPVGDREDILEYMDDQSKNCYFASYSPDMFSVDNLKSEKINDYLKILGIQLKMPSKNIVMQENSTDNKQPKKAKQPFWKRRKN